jgi:hypothetical protein
LKIGDGKTAWKELDYIGGQGLTEADVTHLIEEYLKGTDIGNTITGDNSSIVIDSGMASLAGFVEATEFTIPQKQADGVLRWVQIPNSRTIVEVPENGALTIASKYDESTDTRTYTLDYKLPIATSDTLGGVLSALDKEVNGKMVPASNEVYVNETGKMSVKKVTTDILQNGEMELILNAGTASQYFNNNI